MADWRSIADLACRPHEGRGVAWRAGQVTGHAQWRARVAAWRDRLAAEDGVRWALYLTDTMEFSAALFGAWHAGKRVFLCADSAPVTSMALVDHVDGFLGAFNSASVGDRPLIDSVADVEDSGSQWPALSLAAAALVVYTSGSTGNPIAIEKRLSQLASEVEALEAQFGAALGDGVVHGTVSHQHIYGLLFRVLWPLAAGRPITPTLFFHEQIVTALAHAPGVLVSSPAHLKRIPETIDWSRTGPALSAIFSSGGALPAGAAEIARELLGHAPTEIYGSSETGGVAWRRWNGEDPAWQALPGVEWQLSDGALKVRSPHLSHDDWQAMDDRIQAEGTGFRLLGRADRIVKLEERRISLSAIERGLYADARVEEARALVLPGDREQLAAVVVLSADGRQALHEGGRQAMARALQQALGRQHEPLSVPRRWRFVEALPANAQGKVADAGLRALFEDSPSGIMLASQPEATWLHRNDTAAGLRIELDPGLRAFDGHFPQAAVLPGVAQLDWAVRFARECFTMPTRFLRMEALKFQRVARPGMTLELGLHWDPAKGALTFRYESAQGPHASGRVIFGAAAE